MKKIIFLILILFQFTFSEIEKISLIKIYVPDKITLHKIFESGIDFEGMTGKIGGYMEFVAGDFEKSQLQQKNIFFEIVIDDLSKHYEKKLSPNPKNIFGFGYGSMGGFYTYQEVLKQLDTMKLLFPSIITARESIGTSIEGKGIWCVKISDAPNQFEPNEPQSLYTALHHAREPEGMMAIIYYMWWLLENYNENSEATYLINNRAMYFIPVVNPDGYVYNQTTNPNGGGMWRKNRKNNGGGIFGVDPNRNYGPHYMWNADNGGSSTSPSSETYRGTAPFSEPENQAIDNFMRTHNIKVCLNYHTYGNYVIYPFGYLSEENSDSLIYRNIAYEMTNSSNYTSGTDQQTVNYSTRGNSDDYMFGDTTKPITFAITPEVGTTGFWPTTEEIFPLAIENLGSNKFISYVAGNTTRLKNYEIISQSGDEFLTRNESFDLKLTFRNLGLSNASNLTFSISQNENLNFIFSQTQIETLEKIKDTTVIFSGSVSTSAQVGVPFNLFVTVFDNGGYFYQDTLKIIIGNPTFILNDDASGGVNINWISSGGWNVSPINHTLPNSFHDSPNGNYSANANSTLTLNAGKNLSNFSFVKLQFWTKWAIEPSWDFATVEISTNNGLNWKTLRSKLMQVGSGRDNNTQPENSFGFDHYTPGLQFVKQEVDLSEYIGQTIKIRFRVHADGGEERDGFYVDDIKILGFIPSSIDEIVVIPDSISIEEFAGIENINTIQVWNNSPNTIDVSVAETLLTSQTKKITNVNFKNIFSNFRNKIKLKNQTPQKFETAQNKVWQTAVEDVVGDNFFNSLDARRIDYQIRNIPFIGDFLDLRTIIKSNTNKVLGILSIDIDQNYTTGNFPSPQGIGSPTCDVGSEYDIYCVFNGELADSIAGLPYPFAIIFDSENDSLIGMPLLVSENIDSLRTFEFTIPLEYFNDDRDMNLIGAFINSDSQFGDLIPDYEHGTIGISPSGISWMNETPQTFSIESNDTISIELKTLLAKSPGNYDAKLIFNSQLPTRDLPIHLNIIQPNPPQINLSVDSLETFLNFPSQTDSIVNIGYFDITNSGEQNLMFGIFDTLYNDILLFTPQYDIIFPSQTYSVFVDVYRYNLQPDTIYNMQVLITSNDAENSLIEFPITLHTFSTSVNENNLPKQFALLQNQPNPFNPKTKIKYEIAKSGFVNLKVFDVLGREIKTLVNENQNAGYYEIDFDANNLNSGIYFYKLTTNNFSEMKKMILVK